MIGNPYIWFGRISNPPERHRLNIPLCVLRGKGVQAIDTAEEVFFGLEILIFGLVGFQIRPNVTA